MSTGVSYIPWPHRQHGLNKDGFREMLIIVSTGDSLKVGPLLV